MKEKIEKILKTHFPYLNNLRSILLQDSFLALDQRYL